MLQGKKIIVGITGSIAAYKSAFLVRELVRAGTEVRVVMTPSGCQFISPLTLSTLSGNAVGVETAEAGTWNNHVALGLWGDLLLVAPASANTLAKMAGGLCDNLLLAVYLSARCPVVVAPAMDEDMWLHPATRSNIRVLEERGVLVLPVGKGELASGLAGEGRMAEPEWIRDYLDHYWPSTDLPLKGRKALVTAGPTYEPLDPVRFLGNFSSGKMGLALAQELTRLGAGVDLVIGPHSLTIPPGKDFKVHEVRTAREMLDQCLHIFPGSDMAIMAAAVADFKPANPYPEKIRKSGERLLLELEPTQDILLSLGKMKRPGQLLAGFALETSKDRERAREKLENKNMDLIVLNSLDDPGAGFHGDTNKITLIDKSGLETAFPLQSKSEAAAEIIRALIAQQDA